MQQHITIIELGMVHINVIACTGLTRQCVHVTMPVGHHRGGRAVMFTYEMYALHSVSRPDIRLQKVLKIYHLAPIIKCCLAADPDYMSHTTQAEDACFS